MSGSSDKGWKTMKKLLVLLVCICLIFVLNKVSFADEVCMSKDTAKSIVVSLEKCKINEELLKNQEMLIENLKRQNALLEEEVKLLKETLEVQKAQTEVYKKVAEERKREAFFSRIKSFTEGTILGILLGLVVF